MKKRGLILLPLALTLTLVGCGNGGDDPSDVPTVEWPTAAIQNYWADVNVPVYEGVMSELTYQAYFDTEYQVNSVDIAITTSDTDPMAIYRNQLNNAGWTMAFNETYNSYYGVDSTNTVMCEIGFISAQFCIFFYDYVDVGGEGYYTFETWEETIDFVNTYFTESLGSVVDYPVFTSEMVTNFEVYDLLALGETEEPYLLVSGIDATEADAETYITALLGAGFSLVENEEENYYQKDTAIVFCEYSTEYSCVDIHLMYEMNE